MRLATFRRSLARDLFSRSKSRRAIAMCPCASSPARGVPGKFLGTRYVSRGVRKLVFALARGGV